MIEHFEHGYARAIVGVGLLLALLSPFLLHYPSVSITNQPGAVA
ncbi:hypothetical protein [Neosynechococcus sphagnicola]|nr:hypothetical protein [Neosynechococcus sphagnicola]